MAALETQGIGKLFGPGTSTADLVDYIKAWFGARQSQDA
jgi:methylmalonyl-CoA mutase C-terminal domain/subunit